MRFRRLMAVPAVIVMLLAACGDDDDDDGGAADTEEGGGGEDTGTVNVLNAMEPEENEAVLAGFRARRSDFVPDPLPPAVPAACRVAPDVLRMTPHRHGSDGFTAHRLRRHA